MSNSRLLTTREVAELLGVSTRQVARLATAEKLLPAQQLPGIRGALLFDPADVERFTQGAAA